MKPFIFALIAGMVCVMVGCFLFITGYKPAGHTLLAGGVIAEIVAALLLVVLAARSKALG